MEPCRSLCDSHIHVQADYKEAGQKELTAGTGGLVSKVWHRRVAEPLMTGPLNEQRVEGYVAGNRGGYMNR